MDLIAEPLTAAAFAPFGEVLAAPRDPGRSYFDASLGNARPGARPSLSYVNRTPIAALSLDATMLERHEFSSQTFVPFDVSRWLIVVAPHAPHGGPDVVKARAFIAGPDQGVTYRVNTWHHGLTVLDRPGRFAVFMWRDGGSADEEIVPVTPFTVRVG